MAKLKLDEVHQRIKDMSEDGIEIILEDNNYQGIKKEYSFLCKKCKTTFSRYLGNFFAGQIRCPQCEPQYFIQGLEGIKTRFLENGYEFIKSIDQPNYRGSSEIKFIKCGCVAIKYNSGLYAGTTKCRIHDRVKRSSEYTLNSAKTLLKSLKYGSFTLVSTSFVNAGIDISIQCDKCKLTFIDTLRSIKNKEGKCKMCFGTVKSIHEEYIAILLTDLDIKFQREYNLDKYYFDFYLPDYAILIEYDGIQHTKGAWHTIDVVSNDESKNKLAYENNLELYRINYDDNILKSILKIYENVQRLTPLECTPK